MELHTILFPVIICQFIVFLAGFCMGYYCAGKKVKCFKCDHLNPQGQVYCRKCSTKILYYSGR